MTSSRRLEPSPSSSWRARISPTTSTCSSPTTRAGTWPRSVATSAPSPHSSPTRSTATTLCARSSRASLKEPTLSSPTSSSARLTSRLPRTTSSLDGTRGARTTRRPPSPTFPRASARLARRSEIADCKRSSPSSSTRPTSLDSPMLQLSTRPGRPLRSLSTASTFTTTSSTWLPTWRSTITGPQGRRSRSSWTISQSGQLDTCAKIPGAM
mmetsp:Transcript_28476/g.56958  ORF Transcript_28476/g.56958 Transcript_28476/m.56958 type:complete len:211 (-) Transcript_28476:545-1177(-)